MGERSYKMTLIQEMILKRIAFKIVIQSPEHRNNIIKFYKILAQAVRDEFTEDDRPTFEAFLNECHKESLDL